MASSASRKKPTSVRLSAEAKEILDALSAQLAVSKMAVLEVAIREKAARELDAAASLDNRGEKRHESRDEEAIVSRPIWEELVELANQVPEEDLTGLPTDLAAQHDHYIYGTPKR